MITRTRIDDFLGRLHSDLTLACNALPNLDCGPDNILLDTTDHTPTFGLFGREVAPSENEFHGARLAYDLD
jgi:hypothetical protein